MPPRLLGDYGTDEKQDARENDAGAEHQQESWFMPLEARDRYEYAIHAIDYRADDNVPDEKVC